MSERTDEAERTVPQDEDRVAERFLELEADLGSTARATLSEGTVRRGQIVDAERIPAGEVPDGYPVDVGDGQALAVSVDVVGAGKVRTYLDWPENGEPGESVLGRLLDSLGVDPDRLAALYGQQVLVEVVDSAYVVYVPSEPPRGEKRPVAVPLAAGLAALFGAVVAGGTASTLLFGVFFLVTLFVLPYETYRDAWYLRTHSDWEGGPLFWTALAMVPLLNVVSTLLYLSGRRNATVFGE